MRPSRLALALLFLPLGFLIAQEPPGADPQPQAMRQILDRLDTLERENHTLVEEVHALRRELDASRVAAQKTTPAPQKQSNDSKEVAAQNSEAPDSALDERVTVEEQRTAEQAQTKVEAANRFPIRLNGMLLFNAFANSAVSPTQNEADEELLTGPARSGATVRQTLLGLDFDGPHLPGGGRVNGSLLMDFWAGGSQPGSSWLRIRRANVSLDWANRSFSVGQDKPLIAPYAPDSLAEVGIPPLAGAGNLWLWLPQARYEERLHFGTNTGLNTQLAVMQTDEDYSTASADYHVPFDRARPALEGRLALWHRIDDRRRWEFAPGFHVSTSHVAGSTVSSHIASFDWLIAPAARLQITGTFFKGQNVSPLGALGNGFSISPKSTFEPVDSTGGWSQAAFSVTKRLTWNVFSGIQSDDGEYLDAARIVHNWTYASNLLYHIGPNVMVGFEALQMRTRTQSGASGKQNHYDLALAYLF